LPIVADNAIIWMLDRSFKSVKRISSVGPL